jgi:hypothetical protein
MNEKQLESKVVEYCKLRGLYCRKFASPAHRGVPDRIIVGKGRTMFLELKSEGKKPTGLQLREIELIKAQGILALWTDSWDHAKREIDYCFFQIHHEK